MTRFFVLSVAIISLVFTPILAKDADLHITKIDSLQQIASSQPAQTMYLFDIDDTLIDSPYMFGSGAWRRYIAAATKADITANWHDIFSLFFAQRHPLQTVETITGQFIRDLQEQGHGVFGLTSRERAKWYKTPVNNVDDLTVKQLESVGIDFNSEFLNARYSYLANDSEYFKGIFFADLASKGEYLLKVFHNASQLPEKIVFVDDKLSQVESVAAALEQLGIQYECYWYTAADKKNKGFDPLIANIQLYYFWTSGGENVISDEEACAIAEQCPEKKAEHYLQLLF